ncbi:hypothetical protein PENTCL1PPCAC_13733, partial [Pristionchus entomophagus]
GAHRISIPGLGDDSSDESGNDEEVAQPIDEIVVDPATPEPVGEEVIVEQQEEGGNEVEPFVDDTQEDEEEAEYDPTDAPFLIRRPQTSAVISQLYPAYEEEMPSQQSADEIPHQSLQVDQQEEDQQVDQDDNFFVVDVHARCIKIMPGGYNEKDFAMLEKIPTENFALLNERVHSPNAEDDDHFYCEQCVMSFRVSCPKHPLYRIIDRLVSDPIEDRAKKTKPAFIHIRTSSIPNAGLGAFTNTDLPVGVVFGPYQGILSKESDTKGYSWEIRNVDARSMYLDGSDPKYSNWMRFINSPRFDREQNLVAFQYNGSVYYRVIKPIDSEQELLVWYGAKYGESLGVFKTKRSSTKIRFFTATEVKNPFII